MMLFELEESLSPREAWLRRHRVVTGWLEAGTETIDGIVDEGWEWCAASLTRHLRGFGATEADAIAALAKRMGVPLWFEEAYVNFGPDLAWKGGAE